MARNQRRRTRNQLKKLGVLSAQMGIGQRKILVHFRIRFPIYEEDTNRVVGFIVNGDALVQGTPGERASMLSRALDGNIGRQLFDVSNGNARMCRVVYILPPDSLDENGKFHWLARIRHVDDRSEALISIRDLMPFCADLTC
jgi:hypothetical protein